MDPKAIAEAAAGVQPGGAVGPARTPVQIPPTSGTAFRDVLRQQQQVAPSSGEPLRFSAHALERLQSRKITISAEDMARMNQMADKAAQKGAKSSLFMLRDVAMVVSIKNRVVITAVDGESMKENVFTNIDSAAIIG
ncbi:MAG TPA: TIGR02530 family flagellar biosynthesis protein [Candidatus Dormibacteraeota bacterium]|nr:TIGR02530 family flagellar biosynthesis protein [Candidatus Dormibacteraeota bacterium]